MASSHFHQRFKDKIGVVNRSGEFSSEASDHDASPVSSIGKASAHGKLLGKLKGSGSLGQLAGVQRTSPPKVVSFAQASAESSSPLSLPKLPTKSPFLPEIREQVKGKARLGKLNIRSNSTMPLSQVLKGQDSSFSLTEDSKEFKPYTIDDYKVLKKKTPVRLGGLGPATIGTETWAVARRARDRRLAYSQVVGGKKRP